MFLELSPIYIKLKYMKEISREDLEKIYITEGRTRKEAADYFGVKPYVISNCAQKYGLRKESQEEILAKTLKAYPREKVEELYKNHRQSEMCALLGKITPDILNAVLKHYDLGKRQTFQKAKASISREDLVEVYIKQNNTFVETARILNISRPSLRKLLTLHSIVKSKDLVQRNVESAVLRKYGETNIRRVESFKEAFKAVKQEKYGDPNYNNRNKAQNTDLEKYGVHHHNQNFQISSQIRQHRWLDKSPEELQEIQERVEATNLERYGTVYPILNATLNPKDSKPNLDFAEKLKEAGIQFTREYLLENKSYDFRVGNKLIEINPFATHNSSWSIKGGPGKDIHYHEQKSQIAKKAGFQCIHVWDWDDWDKVVRMLLPKTTLYARKLTVAKIDQRVANAFLKQHHLRGSATMQTACYGLFLNGSPVEVMTFGKPRYNKKCEWELIRLCTDLNYIVTGGAEKLFNAFVKEYDPTSVVSYCDNAKFTGDVYLRLGFTLGPSNGVSRHWYHPKYGIHITDGSLRKRGFNHLFSYIFGPGEKGKTNDELMRDHKFVEIYDSGQSTYIWRKA